MKDKIWPKPAYSAPLEGIYVENVNVFRLTGAYLSLILPAANNPPSSPFAQQIYRR